jgi:hypothetical protein
MSAFTLLVSADDRLFAKQFHRDTNGSIARRDYDKAYEVRAVTADVNTIELLSEVLTTIEADPMVCAIPGRLKPGIDPDAVVYRTLHPQEDGRPACFDDVPRRWIMIDMDKVTIPAGLVGDLDRSRRYLLSLLTPEFQNAAHHYQWSASTGLNGFSTLSIHLFFMLDRPVSNADMKMWANWSNEASRKRGLGKLVDPAVYSAVQVHYTAAPIFGRGVVDPLLGRRSGFVPGHPTVRLNLAPAYRAEQMRLIREKIEAQKARSAVRRNGPASQIWRKHVDRIGGFDGFHEPVRSAVLVYVTHDGSDDYGFLADLHAAIRSAPAGGRNITGDYSMTALKRRLATTRAKMGGK